MNNHKTVLAAAWQQLEKAIVNHEGRPVGTVAALDTGPTALNYDQIFTRDFFVSAVAFLLNDRFEIVKNFLSVTADLQSIDKSMDCFKAGRGLMPASFKTVEKNGKERLIADFGELAIGRVTPVDSSLWWLLLLRLYVNFSSDREFVVQEKIQKTMKAVLDLYLVGHFELIPTLLVPDGAFMIDRRMGMYGHPLDVEVLFYAGLRASREMLALHPTEENKNYMKEVDHRTGHLAYHIRTYYWLDKDRLDNILTYETEEFGTDTRNKYNLYAASIPDWAPAWVGGNGGYFAGNIGPGRMDFRFLTLGNLLAIMTSLADDDQQQKILNLIEHQWDSLAAGMPMKACYPALEGLEWHLITGADPKNSPWSYHNGGSWPFLLWLVAAATVSTDKKFLAKRALDTAATKLLTNDWPEYFDGKDGSQVGKESRKLQVWTIAGYIAAHKLMENPEKAALLSFEHETGGAGCPLKV
ncbi:MAG: glycoside hydrolase 100 family protein [Desulfobulbales bacterium]|nr:glycoside hydrolase 100 family protein [Desulfobulbales bacterium]